MFWYVLASELIRTPQEKNGSICTTRLNQIANIGYPLTLLYLASCTSDRKKAEIIESFRLGGYSSRNLQTARRQEHDVSYL